MDTAKLIRGKAAGGRGAYGREKTGGIVESNPPYFHPACLCLVDVEEGRHTIRLHGDISHYRQAPTGR